MKNTSFRDYMAPADACCADFSGADQRGLRARNRLNEQSDTDRNQPLMPIYDEAFYEQRRQDREAIERIQKRGLRGGANFSPSDAF